MFQLVAVWSAPNPEDRAAFEDAYAQVHVPKAQALAHLTRVDTILIEEGLEGTAPAFYRVAIMTWPDRDAFERDETTEAWRTLRQDAGDLISRFGVTLTSAMGRDA